jgi:hypothetical protein
VRQDTPSTCPGTEPDITYAVTGLAGVLRMMMARVMMVVVMMMGLGKSRRRNQHHPDEQQRQKLPHGPDYNEEILAGNAAPGKCTYVGNSRMT